MCMLFCVKCPDKDGCDRLASKPLVFGFMCIGRLREPTDHVMRGVNDLQFCFRQHGRLDRWHFNKVDVTILRKLLDTAERKVKGGGDAVHTAGATEGHRPGD